MEKKKEVSVKNTPPFKLKDKSGRARVVIGLKAQFGFVPEVIIIEKVPGVTNGIVVRAVMTEQAIKEEEKMREEMIHKISPPIASK